MRFIFGVIMALALTTLASVGNAFGQPALQLTSPAEGFSLLQLCCQLAVLGTTAPAGLFMGVWLRAYNSFRVMCPPTYCTDDDECALNTQSYIDQLEQLLIDIDLLTTLAPLSEVQHFSRSATTEAVRNFIKEATEKQDRQQLDALAVASKALGELLLAKPEGWIDEGLEKLLANLAPLTSTTIWVEEMTIDDLTECAHWPSLLGALRRGAEGRQVCTPHDFVDRVAQRVDEAVRAEVVYVAERLRALGAPQERRSVGRVSFKLVYCPAGEFCMGSDDGVGYDNERPRHRVKLTHGFWMGQTQVTQALWEWVVGRNPSHFKGAQRPVEYVSWFDCVRFCNRLSELEGLARAYEIGSGDEVTLNVRANGYRLPTEAEWEYAAKAGTDLKYSGSDSLDAVAWHDGNSGGKTHPVGQKQPNDWGIYDMTGNVCEWCSDEWIDDYSEHKQGVSDPLNGRSEAAKRVYRGGAWLDDADYCRVACRVGRKPHHRLPSLGLRLCRSVG